MYRWAWKTLFSQRSTLIGSSAGVASAFVLVVFFHAVFTGESEQIVAYIRNTDADIWVMQSGVSNMHMASSFIWDWKADQVAEIPGVADVTPILYLNSMVNAGGRNWFAYIVGLQPESRHGGPWALAAGQSMPGQGEAVIPAVLADLSSLGHEDEIFITDKSFKVVGLSEGTFSMGNPVIFVHFTDLENILSSVGTVSYLLVTAQPGVDADILAMQIEQKVEKVNALPYDEFIASDFQMAMHMGVEIIAIMTFIGSALAVLIIAFTGYFVVSKKRKELAIIKTLGFQKSAIYGGVILQISLITLLGLLTATVVAFTVLPLVSQLVPEVTLIVTLAPILKISLVALSIAILTSLVPAYMIARVDPLPSL